jgi:hypothetical protein
MTSFTAFLTDGSDEIIDIDENGAVETFQMVNVTYIKSRTGFVASNAIVALQDYTDGDDKP